MVYYLFRSNTNACKRKCLLVLFATRLSIEFPNLILVFIYDMFITTTKILPLDYIRFLLNIILYVMLWR